MNPLGRRIVVIGSPGSGKSTFSRRLADITHLPLIHLDKEYWNSGWIETPREEWERKQERLLADEDWISDGNYGRTMDMRFERADTIIWLNLSRYVCILSYFKRLLSNIGRSRPDMPEGCIERLDFEFIKYIWNFPKSGGKGNAERLKNYRHKNIIVFRKRRDANKFLKNLKENKSKL